MYQHNYSTYQQAMRPPSHAHGPPPLHIQTTAPPQPRYHQYGIAPQSASSMSSQTMQQPPPSPSDQSERTSEEEYYNLPGPAPISRSWKGYIWILEVVQHPQRARMCGFGDKDRRPISPPPCVRLVILDATTMKEVDYSDMELAHLVLTVDLYDLPAVKESNIVKQSNASPCISSAATGSFPMTSAQPPAGHNAGHSYDSSRLPAYAGQTPVASTPSTATSYYSPSGQPFPSVRGHFSNGHGSHNGPSGQNGQTPIQTSPYQNGTGSFRPTQNPYGDPRYESSLPSMSATMENTYMQNGSSGSTMYTRNLIGSLCASAFKLKNENDELGIWFVLQDLSVRTEGWFRLKMSFFNLVDAVEQQINDIANGSSGPNTNLQAANTAPCLASTFSNPFKVFSAKKFPGVVESTPLSKAFANQGIKIPIRKEAKDGKRPRAGDSEDEDTGDE